MSANFKPIFLNINKLLVVLFAFRQEHGNVIMVLRNKWTPLQIVITNGYTCSIFQVAKITRKTEITTNNTESLTHLLFIILKLNIINRKFCKYCIYFISSIV